MMGVIWPRFQFQQLFREQGRQAVAVAPTDIAAAQRIAGVGIGGGHLGEIGARAQLAADFFGTRAARGDLFRAGVFRDAHENLRQVQFDLLAGGGFFRFQEIVHFGIGDLDLGIDFVLAQALHDDFITNLFAESRKRRAFLFHLVAQVLYRHFLLFSNTADGTVQGQVIDAHAHFLGQLHLRALNDHALQQLTTQVGRIGQGHVLRLHALLHALDAGRDFVARDHIVIDDDGDGIDGLAAARRWRRETLDWRSCRFRCGGRGNGRRGSSWRGGRRWRSLLRPDTTGRGAGDGAQQNRCNFELVHTGITHNV